jgi:hypothetical protein
MRNRLVLTMPAAGVGSRYSVHQSRQGLGPGWTRDQLPLVGEQAVGDQPDGVPPLGVLKQHQERPIVPRTHEDRHIAYTASDDVEKGRRSLLESPGHVEPSHRQPRL